MLGMRWVGLCAAVVVAASTSARAVPQLLPDDVIPIRYNLFVAPDLQALTWKGTVAISIDVKRPTADVVLNAEGLTFDGVSLDAAHKGTASFDPQLGRATLHFAQPIAPGPHILSIAYQGKIGHETLGFFVMDYQTATGPRRTLATNFEPASARKFLPCWDEPARKATFVLTVDTPNDRMAVSNMPIQHVDLVSATTKRVHFAITPKMSTYLLFLGIGDFERVHRTVDGVEVGVVVKRGDTAKAAYALDQASLLLHYYDDYFGYHYPLPKLDLVAAPGEIEGGSMENWGAIFFSQDELLFDPAISTERDRQDVFETVSHEMSHQWFGDLVTMAWWDNLWLNEGFARWMQVYAADALHPEWETGLQAQSIFENGKQADAEPSTHPIVQEITTAAQALQAFDSITYDKGAAVITMLNAYIGQDAFRDGVRRYMSRYAFGNTVDTGLWSIMQTVVTKPILKIEQDFTRQDGLPLVCESLPPVGMHLEENRFFADPRAAVRGAAQQWTIPLVVAVPGGPTQDLLLNGIANLPLHPPALVNAGQTAYARVLYPQRAFLALLPGVPGLAPVDQLGLMNDSLALGLAGYASVTNPFAVAQKLPADADPIVWRRVAAIVMSVDRHYLDTPTRAAFQAFARSLLAPVLAHIGSEARPGEAPDISLLRSALTKTLGYLGDEAVIATARRMMASGSGTVELQRAALEIAAEAAGPTEFDSLLDRARKTVDPLEKEHIYEALAGVEDPALAKRMIAIALSNEVPAGGNVDVLSELVQNHPDLVWTDAVPHLAEPAAGITRDEQWDVVMETARRLSDPARIPEVQAYVDTNVSPDAQRPFTGAVAAIRQNQRIAARVLPELDRWIASQGKQ
ncbi:MAG TPA: M1 family metallopeptidase [Rhizomicrobium sp.]|nr:M1 family metallopeptidase [Rhizomicrobium sp.]